jgi:hypothetical protein
MWKFPLPGIGHVRAARRKFMAPGIFGTVEPPTRGELSLSLRRQLLFHPSRVRQCITKGDVHDRMLIKPMILL